MAVAGTTLALIASCVGYCVPIHSTVHNRVRPVEPDGQNWHQLDSSPDIAIHKSGLCVSRTPSHPHPLLSLALALSLSLSLSGDNTPVLPPHVLGVGVSGIAGYLVEAQRVGREGVWVLDITL